MTMDETRTRTVELTAGAEEGVIEGYVAMWDVEYPIGRSMFEKIERSAFKTDKPIVMLWEHDAKAGPIGHSRSMVEDDKGLKVEFKLYTAFNERARSIYEAAKAEAVREFSVGFRVKDTGVKTTQRSQGGTLETITKGDLFETSSCLRGMAVTETTSVRAVPAVPITDPSLAGSAAVAAQDPALAGEAVETATTATLMAKIGEVVGAAEELGMLDQVVPLMQGIVKQLAAVEAAKQAAAMPVAQPGLPGAPAPVAPVARSMSAAELDVIAWLQRAA